MSYDFVPYVLNCEGEQFQGASYLGCYADKRKNRIMLKITDADDMTTEVCGSQLVVRLQLG